MLSTSVSIERLMGNCFANVSFRYFDPIREEFERNQFVPKMYQISAGIQEVRSMNGMMVNLTSNKEMKEERTKDKETAMKNVSPRRPVCLALIAFRSSY
jgi:7-cyano-7-deazaguanine synthase in queuosine biosynthesis